MRFQFKGFALMICGTFTLLASAWNAQADNDCRNVRANDFCDQLQSQPSQYESCINKLVKAMQKDRGEYVQKCDDAANDANNNNNQAAEEKGTDVENQLNDAKARGPASSVGMPAIVSAAQGVNNPAKHAFTTAEQTCADQEAALGRCGDIGKGKAAKAADDMEDQVQAGTRRIESIIQTKINAAISGLTGENTGGTNINNTASDSP